MGAKMKSEKNSLVLLSSKRTKADTRTRADEAFALPSFADSTPVLQKETPHVQYKEVEMEHCSQSNVEIMKQTMLKHESMFKEQVHELHRLYQVQRLLMAESRKKDSAFAHSAPPSSSNSSSLSPFTADPIKLAKGRNFWELTSETSKGSKHDYNEFSCKQEQGSPFPENNLGNRFPQDKVKSLEDPMRFSRKVERRTFDLERPAEDYMDDEVQEEKFQEELVLRTPISMPCVMPAVDRLEQQREVHLSLGTRWIREVIDVNERGSHILNPTNNSGEAVRENNSTLKRSRCNEERAFFPVATVRNEGSCQQGPFGPAPISTKSLLGGLLGLNQESRFDDVSISEWQKSNVDHEGRKEESQTLDFEAGERSTQENPKQPHWLLQDPTTATKMSTANSLTQNSGWDQTLPCLMQKQNMIDTSKAPLAPGQKGRPILFQEHLTSGSAWSSVVGLQQGPIFTTVTQFKGVSGEMVNGCMSQPASWKDDGDSHQHSSGMFMHHRHQASTLPSDLWPQLPESEFPLQTQLFFRSGMSDGSCRGSPHGSTGGLSYQQKNLSTAIHQHQQAGIPLTCQGTMPVHVGLVGVQRPAGFYESCVLGVPNELTVKNMNKVSQSIKYANSPFPLVSIPSNLEGLMKQPYDMCSLDATADTELTLGPSNGKLIGRKIDENSDSTETQERDRLTACLQKKVSEEVKWEGSSLKGLDSQETQSGKNQSVVSSFSRPHIPYFGEIGAKEKSKVLAQQVGCRPTGSEGDAISTTSMPSQDLKVVTNGCIQREPAHWESVGTEFGSTTVINEGHGVNKHETPEENAFEDQRQGAKTSKESRQHDHAIHNQQVLPQIHWNGYTLPDHCHGKSSTSEIGTLYSWVKESDNGVEIKLDCETYKSTDVHSTGFLTSDACVEALYSKAGAGNIEQEIASEACLGQEPGKFSSQSTLGANLSEKMLQSRGNITGLLGKADIGAQIAQFGSRDAEIPNLAGSHISHMDNLHVIDNPETFVSQSHNNGLECSVDDHTNQAAEILLSLASNISSGLERVGDYAACTPERSLEWLANVIPQEEAECRAAGLVEAATGLTQPPDIVTFKGVSHCKDFRCREDIATPSEPHIEDKDQRSMEACRPQSLDFFESVTLMLKASGIATDEQSQQVVGEMEDAGEGHLFLTQKGRSTRRGRGGKDFQKEMLPSIASLSRQEITEDLQTIGGLMRSATEVVMRTSGILCRDEASNAPTGQRSTRSAAGARGNGSSDVKNASNDKEKQSLHGFPQISSWGDATRRRRMRRHRSRWSLLPSGTAASWEEPIRPPLS